MDTAAGAAPAALWPDHPGHPPGPRHRSGTQGQLPARTGAVRADGMSAPHALIPRNALVWLLTAQVVALMPHLPRLPLWVAAVWLVCAGWRIQIQRMRWGDRKSTRLNSSHVKISYA